MGKYLKLLGLLITLIILVTFSLFVANQTAQFVALVSTLNPTAGQITLIVLLLVYSLAIAVPLVLLIRLPRSIKPPADRQSQEFAAYLKQIGPRLAANPHLRGQRVATFDEAEIGNALKALDAKADKILREAAKAVFLSTAISQSGRLDAIVVLLAQSRMVWQLAFVYNQRPSIREMASLYANVAVTTFAASQIEDIDISEQVEVVVGAVLGTSLASAVPGVAVVANLITGAVLDGTANAFLTLRVGAIAKRYCNPMTVSDRAIIRRSASAEAAMVLSSVILESAGVVSKAILSAASKTVGNAVLSPIEEATRSALGAVSNALAEIGERASTGVDSMRKRATPRLIRR